MKKTLSRTLSALLAVIMIAACFSFYVSKPTSSLYAGRKRPQKYFCSLISPAATCSSPPRPTYTHAGRRGRNRPQSEAIAQKREENLPPSVSPQEKSQPTGSPQPLLESAVVGSPIGILQVKDWHKNGFSLPLLIQRGSLL